MWCQWDVTKHNMNAKLFCFFQVGLSTSEAKVRDLFEHKDLGIYKNSFMAKVNPSGVIMVKLTPIHYELWFRQCLVRKRFGERSEPSHFFDGCPMHPKWIESSLLTLSVLDTDGLSAHSARPSPHSTTFTHCVAICSPQTALGTLRTTYSWTIPGSLYSQVSFLSLARFAHRCSQAMLHVSI